MSDTEHTTPHAETENAGNPAILPRGEKDYELLARLVIRDGKPFTESAIEAGFSKAVAHAGLKTLMAGSTLVSSAIRAEWDRINVSIDRLKPLAVTRLFREIADPESSNGIKAIEVAGRFKETDWFVRNSETNIGIFAQVIETTVTESDKFKE